jgi:rRNA maturation protein Nop10
LLERDADNTYLTQEAVVVTDEDPSSHLLGSSITYRIAVGPQQGRKVMTLQTIPDCGDDTFTIRVANVAGFSLHAGVATNANERAKLERLCRYITRPAVSTKRLSMTRNGQVRYELKTPWHNGTTHVIFEPLDFMFRTNGMSRAHGCAGATLARLVALVPKPRVNLTRFHGVFAPNSKYRARVTPARRGKRKKSCLGDMADQTVAEKRASATWAKRLKRVFNIEIETCSECGGDVRIIASIEDPLVIQKILAHLDNTASSAASALLPDCRASPGLPAGLFD